MDETMTKPEWIEGRPGNVGWYFVVIGVFELKIVSIYRTHPGGCRRGDILHHMPITLPDPPEDG